MTCLVETGIYMVNYEKETVNGFLVRVFNEILKTEERSITNTKFSDLSLREIHILEMVYNAELANEDNSSTSIASKLRITPGTLTTAVSLLEKKGYLVRNKDTKDKRVVRICTTQLGKEAQVSHIKFHEEMVDDILSVLDPEEAEVFARGLGKLAAFFAKQE